jgi:hypothetical protein
MENVLIIFAVIAVIGAAILRQLKGEPLRGRRIILLPIVLVVIGAMNISGTKALTTADAACIAASAMVAVAIGLAQGSLLHLESRDGGLWGRMPAKGLWWWVALLASRLVVYVIASVIGAKAATSLDSILLVLGLNRLAQAAVIAARAVAACVPFASEKDGKSFLSGVVGTDSSASMGATSSDSTPIPLNGASWSDISRRVTSRFN